MREFFNTWLTKMKPIKETLVNPKTAKIFRITYSVIWNFILIFLIFLIIGGALGFGIGAGYFASLIKDEHPRTYEELKKDIYSYEEPSELYFADNLRIGYLRSDIIREEVGIKDISDYVKKAVIATEDQNFETHEGVVPKAVLRALFQEVTNSTVQTGGSTLTQQLVKNQVLSNEVSFERKAKEILLALRLEKFFKKDEILEAYLNVSPFGRNSSGQNIAGVQAAAKGIFGVSAKELNLPQAAFIAGLPQSPFGYTPFTNKGVQKSKEGLKPGLTRQKIVLKRMLEMKFITRKEYDEAVKYDTVKDFIPPQKSIIEKYPYLIIESERQAIAALMESYYKKDGYTKEDIEKNTVLKKRYETIAEKDLRQNGYKIYTTVDQNIYDKWQNIIDQYKKIVPYQTIQVENSETGKKVSVKQPLEVGAMLIENKTGKIISFVGGLDHKRENYNHATQGERSNGSTMKPLAVYGPAIDMGLASPGTVIADVDHGMRVGGRPWPQNFSRRYYGLTSARTALTHSYNVSAVNLYQKIMPNDPVQYLEKLGIGRLTKADHESPALALGGLTNGVTVEENTNAYAAFGNNGSFVDSSLIDKIVDKDGNIVYEPERKATKVFSPQAAYLTVDMMRDVVRRGTAAALPGQLKFSTDLAGKTGTSSDTHDLWFVGLNPNVTLGVWIGFDVPNTIPSSARKNHLSLWAKLMNAAYDENPDLIGASDRFHMPGGIVKRSYCGISGLLPSNACARAGMTLSDYFIAEHVPTKVDNSLIDGTYVTIGDKKYVALASTPSEFTSYGVMLNPDFVKQIAPRLTDVNQLIPSTANWKNVFISTAKMSENGKVPAPLKATLSGNKISWNKHSESDIVGYRIYRVGNGGKGGKIGSIKAGSSLTYSLPGNGQYAVVAVDIAGQESPLSNIVTVGAKEEPKPKPEQKETDKKEQPDKQQEKKPEDNPEPAPDINVPEVNVEIPDMNENGSGE